MPVEPPHREIRVGNPPLPVDVASGARDPAHTTQSGTRAWLSAQRLGGLIPGGAVLITADVVRVTPSRSLLVPIPVLLLVAVLAPRVMGLVGRRTAALEHPSPPLAAQRGVEGVGDPDPSRAELVEGLTPASLAR